MKSNTTNTSTKNRNVSCCNYAEYFNPQSLHLSHQTFIMKRSHPTTQESNYSSSNKRPRYTTTYHPFQFTAHTTTYFHWLLRAIYQQDVSLDTSQIQIMNCCDSPTLDNVSKELEQAIEQHQAQQDSDPIMLLLLKYGLHRIPEGTGERMTMVDDCIHYLMSLKNSLQYDAIAYTRLLALFHNLKGYYFMDMNDYQSATRCFNLAIETVPDYAIARTNRAYCYSELGQIDKAYYEYTALIKQFPFYSEFYVDRADLLASISNFDEAIRDYSTAVEMKGDEIAYYNRCVTFSQMGLRINAVCDANIAKNISSSEHASDIKMRHNELLMEIHSLSSDCLFEE
jgi:tetratricopeptide (TPR) repeat protein